VDRVRTAAPGGRNHAVYTAARHLGRLVGAQSLTSDQVASALYQAASVHLGPTDADLSPAETRAAIRSGLAAGIANPRTVTTRSAA
jgi:predicted kinase